MRAPVTNKADMYRRIVAGEFGNTLPRWFDVDKWLGSSGFNMYRLWGVQHASITNFPGTRLDVNRTDVVKLIQTGGFGKSYCISPMVHQIGNVQWEGDVWIDDFKGLSCSGNMAPAPGSWRRHMLAPRLWEWSRARALLRHVLNGNSYDDLTDLLELYPGHVVELSALDCCFGTCRGRNAVVWECRKY